MVVSKTRDGVKGNCVTEFFPFFFSSFNLLLLTLFVCLLFCCLFFPVEKKIVNIIRFWQGFSRHLAKFTAFLEALFSAGALSHPSIRSVSLVTYQRICIKIQFEGKFCCKLQ